MKKLMNLVLIQKHHVTLYSIMLSLRMKIYQRIIPKALYVILKALGSFVIMYFIIKLLYTYAPSKKIDKKTTVRGSIFTSIGWIVATYTFSFYITNIASYDVVYGNFANVLILLLWVYILAYLFVIGMALNVDRYHKQRMWVDENKKTKKEQTEIEESDED